MFDSFFVYLFYRDYLCFVWYEDNDIIKLLVDYRMKVYVFGNGLSLVVVVFGLRKIVDIVEKIVGVDVKEYIYKNFYVDDVFLLYRLVEEVIMFFKKVMKFF